jgi:hypothetical protein
MLGNIRADHDALRTDQSRGTEGDDPRATRHVKYPFTTPEIGHSEQACLRWSKLLLPVWLIVVDRLIPSIALDAPL